MTKMRQVADGQRPGLRQKTPDACGETPTETNIAPVAFNRNHNSVVCLPLLSESQRLIWVQSNQIDLQLDGAAELDKAFDRFPYLTQKQTVALAQRCSLHPDQVKVWFMVQRLRYGISWDYKDIQEIRRKITSSQEKDQGEEELQNRMGEEVQENRGKKEKQKREVKESGERKAGKVKEEQSANEGRMMGENVRASELLESKMKQQQEENKEKDRKVETVEEVKRNTRKKRKKMAVADKMGKKRMKQDHDGIVEGERQTSNLSETKVSTKEKRKAKAKERLMSGQEWPANKSSPHVMETCSFPTGIFCSKRQHQLAMMKAAFSSCQYPTADDYDRMALLIGIPRYMLVQWFGDMRYYVKRGRPRWMNQVQHSQALANINYQQYLNKLAKAQPRKATWRRKCKRSESTGKDESVKVPLE
ncbi:homeobox and leucine zipper encoding b [Lates calcarifer]|uniref:Zinc fingers and homeoboxes protein 1 n=1 Tax=Lates calcarifer TaxID=8187 RepID=A0A4W6BJC8_LATCA|nr:homeobox and leucine zipper encoding b [Lates calcarifer]XP_018560633.1 homeobox and leucine zipper encoding b [Lates calcarifer]XP_018560634.1 homeobox and leucine zipper encoding b [Lates calcarifer]